jgi:hypothetical protein
MPIFPEMGPSLYNNGVAIYYQEDEQHPNPNDETDL